MTPRKHHLPVYLAAIRSQNWRTVRAGGEQSAEAFFFMVMASELRQRAEALCRRYGLGNMEMRAEVLRYLVRLDETPASRPNRNGHNLT